MISFKPYASGSTGNLYTVSDGKTTVMLDCGLSWRKVRELLNFHTSEISGICITHAHLDHARGCKDAVKAGMDVYASESTFDQLGIYSHRSNHIEDGRQFRIGTWSIIPFATIHDCDGSLGFLMANRENERFLYLTDTMYSPVKFPPLSVIAVECNNIDELLIENVLNGHIPAIVGRRIRRNHMSLNTLIELIKANDLSLCSKIYLLHLSDHNSNAEQMKLKVQSQTGIPTETC